MAAREPPWMASAIGEEARHPNLDSPRDRAIVPSDAQPSGAIGTGGEDGGIVELVDGVVEREGRGAFEEIDSRWRPAGRRGAVVGDPDRPQRTRTAR